MRLVPELGLVASELGWVPSPTYVLRRAAVLRRLRTSRPGRVLEIGCGSGALLYELGARGFTGVGVESSPAARALAMKVLAGQQAVSVVEVLPAEDDAFDYLLSFEVLEHIEQDRAALWEWVRRLKPEGLCLLSVPAHSARWNVTDTLAGHFRRYDRADVEQLVRDAGLCIRCVETYGFPATWVIERVRLATRWAQLRSRGVAPAEIEPGDAERTGRSGIDRELETRLFPIYGSWLGRRWFELAASAQEHFSGTDWGISYMVTAQKCS